ARRGEGSRRRAACTRRSGTRGSRSSRGIRLPSGRRLARRYIAHEPPCKGTLTRAGRKGMSTGHILLLGAIAGATIFLGLPVGRMRVGPAYRAGLSALATGILIFLLWDVLTGAVDPIDAALNARHWGRFSWLAALGLGGFTVGLMSLVHYSEWMKARGDRR